MQPKNRLKILRDRSRLTQRELGTLVHRHPSLIARQEQGKRPLSHSDIQAFSRVFKCETYEIFSEPIETIFPEIPWDNVCECGTVCLVANESKFQCREKLDEGIGCE